MPDLLLISRGPGDTRAALVKNGVLTEFYLERRGRPNPTGNVYRGRVLKVLPGMDAVFVDIGLERPAYLAAQEVVDEPWGELAELWLNGETSLAGKPTRRRPVIGDLLSQGQEVVVQVYRPPLGNKGARLTTHITLPAHYLVYAPTLARLGVSRRIPDEAERERLKGLLADLQPQEGGLIARTAAQGQGRETLGRERDNLVKVWRKICRLQDSAAAPALLYAELALPLRLGRDLFGAEADRVVMDDTATHAQVSDYLSSYYPRLLPQLELYSGPDPLFAHYGLDVDWRRLLNPQVWLKSGGYLLFQSTEALTAIDVNTGKFTRGDRLEETILKTNLEAAQEIARQLRLRNLGGIIVIDFIDMARPAHREHLYNTFLEALKSDRARTTVLPLSPLGLLEMTRQRLGESLLDMVTEPCEACQGLLLSPLVLAHDILRQLAAEAREFPGYQLTVTAAPEVVEILKAEGGSLFKELSRDHRTEVLLIEQPRLPWDRYDVIREWPVK